MKEGARVQAAIDVLDRWKSASKPIENVLRDWARNNRYAGSKDRRAISAYVYAVIRNWGRLAWGTETPSARQLILSYLDTQGEEGWKDLFDGQGYNPEPIQEGEIITPCEEKQVPFWAEANVPEWLWPELEKAFGSAVKEELLALDGRAPIDLRVNTLKHTVEEIQALLDRDGVASEPTPFGFDGVRIQQSAQEDTQARRLYEELAVFKRGGFEFQDAASQFVVDVCGAEAGQQVIDFCAGAGGKTLNLAAKMGNKGQIYAFDTNSKRMKNLPERLKRADVRNVQICLPKGNELPSPLLELTDRADLVLLDAPCSGSGAWRRHPDAKWRLNQYSLKAYMTAQDEVLESGKSLVRPGGTLVYATCSVLPCENEERITDFCERNTEFTPDLAPFYEFGEDLRMTSNGAQLSPFLSGTDGFFVSVLRRES